MRRLTLCVGLWLAAAAAFAHETPIALLSLKEVGDGVFLERWTYSSSRSDAPPTPIYPEHCSVDSPRVNCGEAGLSGRLTFSGLGERYSAAVVRVLTLDGQRYSFTLTAANPDVTLTSGGGLALGPIAAAYVALGIEHILLGVDHLLFVFGLILLVASRSMLVKTITAFTVAHSLTLAGATFGWLGVPEQAVNAAIALSIVVVAIEILKLRRGRAGLSARYPWAVAFGFGLLHGFGFAGALTGLGLPGDSLPAALLFFNVGVELGQLAFVTLVLALGWAHRRLEAVPPRWLATASVYSFGLIAAYWFYDRLAAITEPLL